MALVAFVVNRTLLRDPRRFLQRVPGRGDRRGATAGNLWFGWREMGRMPMRVTR